MRSSWTSIGLLIWAVAALQGETLDSVWLPGSNERIEGLPDVRRVSPTDLADVFRNPLPLALHPEQVRVPGDPRPYRHGTHQGIDFYGVRWGTPVYPAAPGVVVRVDRDYVPLRPEDRAAMLRRCAELGATPGEFGVPPDPIWGDILDRLRGRQVWLYHGRNAAGKPVLTVYAHLSATAPLQIGQFVDRQTIIGQVGNSGTSQEGRSQTAEVHLHLEIWIGHAYWSPRRPDERGKRLSAERQRTLRERVIAALAGTQPAGSRSKTQ